MPTNETWRHSLGFLLSGLFNAFSVFSRILAFLWNNVKNLEKTNKKTTTHKTLSAVLTQGIISFCFVVSSLFSYFTVSGLFATASVIKCADVVHIQAVVQ